MAKKLDNRNPVPDGFTPDSVHDTTVGLDGLSTEDAARPVSESTALTPCDLFDLLSNRRRWYAVYYFKHYTTTVELGGLATQIAAWENDMELSEVTGTERKRVYTSLQQVHLPKMDELGVVEFDKRSGQIKAAPFVTDIELSPGSSDGHTRSLNGHYIALATAHGALVLMFLADIWPLAPAPLSVEVAAFALSLALLTVLYFHGTQ